MHKALAGLLLTALLVPAPGLARAQPAPSQRSDFWSLKVGAPVAEQPADFQEFACGTDGGPPSTPLKGFKDFATCPADASGLHEVQFRYDDEVEYWALAMQVAPVAERYAGTSIGEFPVIISALFDDGGVLRGVRAVSDDRTSLRNRRSAYTLAIYLKGKFGTGRWTCEDLPATDGQTPVGNRFVKQDCTARSEDGLALSVKARLLHRRGQTAIDPHTNQVRKGGQYESTARFEMFDPSITVVENAQD
ncbi:hypothetical protein XM25_04420 [Devosia sp. H5989]|nr:hypothetical protein XM25_04420 [Devosia sp. H5989]